MIRLGLCCQFVAQPIKFRTATATYVKKLQRSEQLSKLSALCLENAQALLAAIDFCAGHAIGCFRVNSQIWPLKTHPEVGYDFFDLPDASAIAKILSRCRVYARRHDIRLTFHPDQFVLLSSPRPDVVKKSIEELNYQAQVSDMIGADVINIHAGGSYGDKKAALKRMAAAFKVLKPAVRKRLTLENDDRLYTPSDLLSFCQAYKVPLVYDVHHHRCLPDGWTIQKATDAVLKTWNREPVFHISSARQGWAGLQPAWHHDYIDPKDFPRQWRGRDVTVEVEAKAKELAVFRLDQHLQKSSMSLKKCV